MKYPKHVNNKNKNKNKEYKKYIKNNNNKIILYQNRKKFIYKKACFNAFKKWKDSINKNEECPICLNNISSLDKITTKCNHIYCKTCLKSWLEEKDSCPICRHTISKQTIHKFINIPINTIRIYETIVRPLFIGELV